MRKGSKQTVEAKRKMSESKRDKMIGEKNPFYGKIHSEETRKKISEANKGRSSPMKGKKTGKPAWNSGKKGLHVGWNKGKSASPEAIRKMVETRKMNGSYKHTEEQKEKLRQTMANPEVKRKYRESIQKAWANPALRKKQSESHKGKNIGKDNYFYGKTHSEEAKKTHSEYMKEYFRTHKHPMIGKKRQVWNKNKKGLQIAWNKGKKMPELSEWGRKNILKQYESGIFPKQENTKPERQIKAELIKRAHKEGIDFVHQYKFMNKFMCDFCFPKQKVIIEVYGDFWHANPEIYPEGIKLHPHQIKGKRIDKSKEAYISKVDNHSWTYLVLWESDIKKDVAKSVDNIEEILKKKK